MSALPVTYLYTQDPDLIRRIRGYLHSRSEVQPVREPSELTRLLLQSQSVLVFADLRAAECTELIPVLVRDFPGMLLVALGESRSDPGLAAAKAGIYGMEAAEAGRLEIQSLFNQAQMYLKLRNENRMLRDSRQQPPPPVPQREQIIPSLHHFSGALRRFDNIGSMLESIVEGVAGCTRVARVAVFSITPAEKYRFRAGIKCMEEVRALEFKKSHPFILWLQVHAHSISRSMLRHIESIDERLLLEKTLDRTGSEAILPLFGRERLIGWLCLGRLSSGAPFEQNDIEELSVLAEQISVAIENSLLHENIALQKALAENLLQAIPVGIIAAGGDGTIRWFNRGAELFLRAEAADLIEQPVEKLPGCIASLLNRCIAGEKSVGPVEWTEPLTGRDLLIQTRRLQQNGQCMGAMAVLNDLTEERLFREKQNNLERAKFWNELTRAISHEVRNPLVAISTFSQLLPERYADEEFRTQFRDLTTQEVDRLNTMIDQLDEFAAPPSIQFISTDVSALLNTALCKARSLRENPVDVTVETAPDTLLLKADVEVLSDSIARLLDNSFAAVEKSPHPRIVLKAFSGEIGAGRPAAVIEVQDNGCGIPEESLNSVFSPFFTTKARGVGLGLPIVRRTMIDHEGLVSIDSGKNGTTVRLVLPAFEEGEKGTNG